MRRWLSSVRLVSAPVWLVSAPVWLVAAPVVAQAPEAVGQTEATAEGEYDPRTMRTEGLDDGAARSRFRVGQTLYAEGRFGEAATEFERAYQLSQRGSLLFNAYLAYRDAGMLADATRTLGLYLEASPEVDDAVALRARHQAMLASVQQQRAELEAQEAERRRLESEREDLARQADVARQHEEEARQREEEVRLRAAAQLREADRGGLQSAGIAVGAAGLGAVVGGVVTGLLANAQYDELDENCPDGRCIFGYDAGSNERRGRRLALTTDVLLFGGAAITVTGLVLFLLSLGGPSDADERASESVTGRGSCGPAGCSAELEVRF